VSLLTQFQLELNEIILKNPSKTHDVQVHAIQLNNLQTQRTDLNCISTIPQVGFTSDLQILQNELQQIIQKSTL
jgi:hypothetical protein